MDITNESTEPPRRRVERGPALSTIAVLGALLLYVIGRVVSSWRYFDRLLGDDGWVFRVAQRVAEGDLLYRDVAWSYGPVPIYALAALLRLVPTVVWFHLVDILLCVLAIAAVQWSGRILVGRGVALAVTAWAAVLGSSGGLISHQLDAYTVPVAWGTAASLATVAAACSWLHAGSRRALIAACVLAILAVLSKPEYGLAALCVLATSVWLRRPSRRFITIAFGLAAAFIVVVLLRVEPSTIAAAWRGYTGYDLIAVGSVPVVARERMLGSLLVSIVVVPVLWWTSRLHSFVLVGSVLLLFLLIMWIKEGGGFLHATSIVAEVSWLGFLPLLLWIGWTARGAQVSAGLWVLWIYCITVSLRWFLLGSFTPAAAGPMGLLMCMLVKERVLPGPTPAGWIALATFLSFSSVESELSSLRRPTLLEDVKTTLGTVRLPASISGDIESIRIDLDAAPPGGLFVAGGGPGWYLLSDRQNPTRFDVLFAGIGTTEPEAAQILDDLRVNPPAVVIFERDFHATQTLSPERIWNAIGESGAARVGSSDGRWTFWHVDRQ